MVVEDNPRDAEIIVRELRNAGFDVGWTRIESESQYLAALETLPDLIICDYSLPQFDGLRALDLLVERDLEIPFILVSGTIGEERAAQAIQRGADDYLLKDRLARLGPAVHRALDIGQTRKERKAALAELHQSERAYRQLVDSLPVAVYTTDTSGRVTLFNEAAVALWGQPPDALNLYSNPMRLLDLEGREIPVAQRPTARVLAENRGILGAEYVLERADATRRHVLAYPHPIRSEDGTLTGAVSLILDVTELRQAQQALLAAEVFAQATIDSVSAHICVLDETGTVVAVNLAWREFGQQSYPQPEESTAYLGTNYLQACEGAVESDTPEASPMASGIRQVMDGTLAEFTLEYPCHSPSEQRWFLARVTRFLGASRNVVVAHEDITERKLALEVLEASEAEQRNLVRQLEEERARLVAAQRVAKVGSWETDRLTLSVRWSDETHRIHETDPATFDPSHQRLLALVHPADREAVDSAFAQIHHQGDAHVLEHRLLLADGRIKHVEERWLNVFDAQGKAIRAVGTCQDVSERKLHEQQVARLSRVQMLLSGINMLIVRVNDPGALYQGACRIAVEDGGFLMAMLVLVDPANGGIRVAATAGKDEDFAAEINHVLATPALAEHSLTARAIREQQVVVANDCRTDNRLTLAAAFCERGVKSLAVFPLLVAEQTVGAFVLYSAELDFFGSDELGLLTELTDDIAFAMDHIEKSERLAYLAFYDQLTGLPNAQLFQDQLDRYIAAAAQDGGQVCVFVLDLDGFTDINRRLGRQVGDALLRAVATRLQHELPQPFALARTAADTFAVASPSVDGVALGCDRVRDCTLGALREVFRVAGQQIRISGKVGIAVFPEDGNDGKAVLLNAESALKRAKSSKQNYLYSSNALNALATARLTLEGELREALVDNQFRVHYQPRVDMARGDIVGAEALIRWQHPVRGLLAPGEFIELAEESALIVPIGAWMLQAVCAQQADWVAAGLPTVPVAVNVSAVQFEQGDLLQVIRDALQASALAPRMLHLELTESAVMGDPDAAAAVLQAVRALGVELALDDFGTGYSSLASIKRYPFSMVKIDRSFVTHITSNVEDAAIAGATIAMAHRLRLKVVAEGVETQGQFNYLRAQGCDEMQGYLFSRPVAAEAFAQMLRLGTRLPMADVADEAKPTLLLVDDERGIRSALTRLLRQDGYRILSAGSGEDGLELLALNAVQVIISDQRMPGMSGTEFLGKVSRLYPATVRILLSGYTDLKVVTEGVNQGAVFKFVTKPWDDDQLRQQVREAFAHQQTGAGG